MLPSLTPALSAAIDAARAAGALLRAELLRPEGPRGPKGKCPADDEAEALIRDRLLAATPAWGFLGEETGRTGVGPFWWVVDPNDGTSAMQAGGRGASVSIALVHQGAPVLGVIYAYAPPLGGAELYSWAEGCGPLRRNGVAVDRQWATQIGPDHTILISQAADRRSAVNAGLCAPARFRPVVSLAYRMALCAAGAGEAATSLGGPLSHDMAAGHALLRGVGGVVLDRMGRPVTYDPGGENDVGGMLFCGHPTFAATLAARDWAPALRGPRETAHPDLVAFAVTDRVPDDDLLDRARGCWLGQLAGDDLGARVEFQPATAVQARFPGGVRRLVDGGHWDTLAGQPTDDSELALALARSIVEAGGYVSGSAALAYADWLASEPFDIGNTTRTAFAAAAAAPRGPAAARAARAAASRTSQANGALMRLSPLAIWGHALPAEHLAGYAVADARLSHPHPTCLAANAVVAVALGAAIREGLDPEATWAVAVQQAQIEGDPAVTERLHAARLGPPDGADGPHQGWVLVALQNAFHQLLSAPSVEDGLARTIALGGDTDTNAAIAGALLGAVHGARSLPAQWVDRVLSCRPLSSVAGVRRPRPKRYWPVDALLLAERLVRLGLDEQAHAPNG